MATVCAKSMSLRRLLSTAYTTDLMLILMYGILMNVCCCFNSVLNLPNGLHIETNWLRSRKRVGFFSLLYTMPHRCKDELLLFSYFMGLCAVVDFFYSQMTIVQFFGETHGYNGFSYLRMYTDFSISSELHINCFDR